MQAAARIFSESVIPAAEQQRGFRDALFLTDPATGKGLSVTLWETREDLEAGEHSGYFQEQVAKFAPLLAGPPIRKVLVVAATAWASPEGRRPGPARRRTRRCSAPL